MRLIAKNGIVILAPDNMAEADSLEMLSRESEGRVFRLSHSGRGIQFIDLGPEDEARNRPINITSQAPPPFDLISNFAHTPFELDGARYASVEGFWQSLQADDPAERERIAALHGSEAKRATTGATRRETFVHGGKSVRTGTFAHWRLMRRAVIAKFEQNAAARAALLATGTRPLTHRVRPDSRTIPGAIMADIWMAARRRLQRGGSPPS